MLLNFFKKYHSSDVNKLLEFIEINNYIINLYSLNIDIEEYMRVMLIFKLINDYNILDKINYNINQIPEVVKISLEHLSNCKNEETKNYYISLFTKEYITNNIDNCKKVFTAIFSKINLNIIKSIKSKKYIIKQFFIAYNLLEFNEIQISKNNINVYQKLCNDDTKDEKNANECKTENDNLINYSKYKIKL